DRVCEAACSWSTGKSNPVLVSPIGLGTPDDGTVSRSTQIITGNLDPEPAVPEPRRSYDARSCRSPVEKGGRGGRGSAADVDRAGVCTRVPAGADAHDRYIGAVLLTEKIKRRVSRQHGPPLRDFPEDENVPECAGMVGKRIQELLLRSPEQGG